MSWGLGAVQRAILATIKAELGRGCLVDELAAYAYPSRAVTHARLSSVRPAVSVMPGLSRRQTRAWPVKGWRHLIERASS